MENNMYTEEQLMARLKFFIGVCLSFTLVGIVFVVLYSLIFVSQPLNAISPIDQKFFELIVPIATFLTGTLSGIMLSGASKEDKEAMMEMHKRAEANFEATKKVMHDVPKQETVVVAPMGASFGQFSAPRSHSPLAEATTMPVFAEGDPTHRNSRND